MIWYVTNLAQIWRSYPDLQLSQIFWYHRSVLESIQELNFRSGIQTKLQFWSLIKIMFDKSFPHFLPKLSRKTSTNFLGPNILNCTYQRLVNFDIVLLCLQFPPKNEQKQVDLRYHSSKVEFVCSFFGRNVGLKNSFPLCLTISRATHNWMCPYSYSN